MPNKIESAAAQLGRLGGQARTDKKIRSARRNIKKALAVRRQQLDGQKNGKK